VRMQLLLRILKFCMGELRLQLRRDRLALHGNLVKVHRLVQAHHNQYVSIPVKLMKRTPTPNDERKRCTSGPVM